MSIKAIILVGGETTGTRFRPLSMDVPKALFPIAGKPIVSHIIDSLLELADSGLEEVYLLGYFKDTKPFDKYIEEMKDHYPDLRLKYLSEPYSMGTGGGLFHFREEIFDNINHNKVIVIHGDIVCNYPFKSMYEFFEKSQANMVVLGIDPILLLNNYQNHTQVQNRSSFKIYENNKVLSNYGTIIANKSNNRVVHYVEKPSSSISELRLESSYYTLVNGGVYIFDKTLLEFLVKAQQQREKEINYWSPQFFDADDNFSASNSSKLSLELDVLKTLPEANSTFLTFKSNSFWYQLKTPVSALLTNNFFLEKELQKKCSTALAPSSMNIIPPVKIGRNTVLHLKGYKIGPNVSIGDHVSIGNGVRLKNCIIADNTIIGDHSYISGAIISTNVIVGKWCRIEGTFDSPTITRDITKIGTDGYFKLINNISVLCQNNIVKDQVVVYNSIVLPHKELKQDIKNELIM